MIVKDDKKHGKNGIFIIVTGLLQKYIGNNCYLNRIKITGNEKVVIGDNFHSRKRLVLFSVIIMNEKLFLMLTQ